MALASTLNAVVRPDNSNFQSIRAPIQSDWQTVCTDCTDDDNLTNSVVNPGAITSDKKRYLRVNRKAHILQVRQKYDDGNTSNADMVIQVFGRDQSSTPLWQALTQSNGTTHEISVPTAETTDVTDGTDKWTVPVEVELAGDSEILVAIKTPYGVSSGTATDSSVEVRLLSLR